MPLISPEYRALNKQMHDENPHYGVTAGFFATYIQKLYLTEAHASILDYGCGKGVLKQIFADLPIAEYDPAIDGKDTLPDPADMVVCIDVLEHIEPIHLNSVLRHLRSCTKKRIFGNIATRPAEKKMLPDGRNPHLSLHDEAWWRDKMADHFQITRWLPRKGLVTFEGFPITGPVMSLEDRAKGKRRPYNPQFDVMFQGIREQNARYIDEFNRIKTIRMWEGVGDQPADMQCAVNILNDFRDIDAAVDRILKLSAKCAMFHLTTSPDRTPAMWRTNLEHQMRIADWFEDPATNTLLVIGSPMVGVQGINAVGCVDSGERFEAVRAACKRIPKRIEPVAAHTTPVIVACYGPSLVDTIEQLKDSLRQNPHQTVVSVSGSHDFLISHGVVPDYHVECDPRPHKADNIAAAHPGVKYLIASSCHAKVFDKLEGADVYLWHVATPEHGNRIVDELGEAGIHMVSGGGSVGLRSIPLLYGYGYRDFAYYGMDCSFAITETALSEIESLPYAVASPEWEEALKGILASGVQQWAGAHAGKRQDVVPCQCAVPGASDRIFATSPILMTYATNFFETVQKVNDCNFRLAGDGLLQAMAVLYSLPTLQKQAA